MNLVLPQCRSHRDAQCRALSAQETSDSRQQGPKTIATEETHAVASPVIMWLYKEEMVQAYVGEWVDALATTSYLKTSTSRIPESYIPSSPTHGEAEPCGALSIGWCTMSATHSNSYFLAMCSRQDLKPVTLLFLFTSQGAFCRLLLYESLNWPEVPKHILKYIVGRDILPYSYFKLKVIFLIDFLISSFLRDWSGEGREERHKGEREREKGLLFSESCLHGHFKGKVGTFPWQLLSSLPRILWQILTHVVTVLW